MKMLALYSYYQKAKEAIRNAMTDDNGQTIVEYVLLIVLIALIVFATNPGLTQALTAAFNRIAKSVSL